MNWLKLKLRNWVLSAHDEPEEVQKYSTMAKGNLVSSSRDINSDPTLHFKVYNAVGGKIVEFSRYDRKSDRAEHQIYIIGKEEDFGEKISKISTLEVLR